MLKITRNIPLTEICKQIIFSFNIVLEFLL